MVLLLSCLFRLLLWTLLTSDLSAVNLAIGVGLALLLPHARGPREPLAPTLRALMRSLIAVPLAYGEAFALIGSGDREEESWIERPAGDPRHRLLIFLEVLAITLTPFTIVLGLSNGERGPHYTIHQLRPRRGKPEEVQP
jgi:multicomponent Na+:H+ antiporter subunit E